MPDGFVGGKLSCKEAAVGNAEQAGWPRLTVVGSAEPAGTFGWWSLVADGTVAVSVGAAISGGFGVEAAKSFFAGETAGRAWFVAAFVAGVGVVGFGLWLRRRARRRVRVGIVVSAMDGERGSVRARQLEQQAEVFSRSVCALTLKVSAKLPGDAVGDRRVVDALAEEALSATMMAERLSPDAARINLIPTMPLHVGFWFGARLGYTHAREVVVHAIRQSGGVPAYFPATVLRAVETRRAPLVVDPLVAIKGGDQTSVALALDLQGRGDRFFAPVLAACRSRGVGYVLPLRSESSVLDEDMATFSGVVEQVCRAWRDVPLPADARTGRHGIFLSGPVAIAVALGARLAAPERGRWTAYTFDPTGDSYSPFPAPGSGS